MGCRPVLVSPVPGYHLCQRGYLFSAAMCTNFSACLTSGSTTMPQLRLWALLHTLCPVLLLATPPSLLLLLSCSKKQHYGRKHHPPLLRCMYNTPLPDLDGAGKWSLDVKQQHYAQLPGRDVVAQLSGFPSANAYWIPRADLNPSVMPEFQAMVNSVMPWLGRALARVTQVRG